MTKFNQALIAAASSVVLLGGAVTLITPAPARAEFDWSAFGRAVNDAAQDYNRQVQQDTQRMLDRQRNCTTTFYGAYRDRALRDLSSTLMLQEAVFV